MKKVILSLFILPMIAVPSKVQTDPLPVEEWPSASQTPMIFYVSGDGGMNEFSEELCGSVNKAGYSITALNARAYFWNKKTPAQTAEAISIYLGKKFQNRKNQQLVLSGYSFGADVIPFIVNNLPDTIKRKLISVVLLSPSGSTDFQVHLSDMLGGNKKREMDVVAEINKMNVPNTAIISGNEEDVFPLQLISLKNYKNEQLPGGHTFDGNTAELGKAMIKYFK